VSLVEGASSACLECGLDFEVKAGKMLEANDVSWKELERHGLAKLFACSVL
jgi:hypothetical protein